MPTTHDSLEGRTEMTDTREAMREIALGLAGFYESTWVGDIEDLIRFAAENRATFSVQPYCSFKSGRREFAGSVREVNCCRHTYY